MPMFQDAQTRQLENQGRQAPASTPLTVQPYPLPGIEARLNGETVTITGSIDWPGHSPAKEYIDQNGRINYEVTEAFIVTDRNVLPSSDEQMEQVRQTALQAQTRGISQR